MSRITGAAVAGVLAAAGILAMTACGPAGETPGDSATAQITSGGPNTVQAEDPEETTQLLLLNDRLREELGTAYSQGWIETGQLHVAVTTEEAVTAVSEAGAIPELVKLNSSQLEEAVTAMAAWQGKLAPELATGIHKISSDGRTGKVTISVAEDKIPAIEAALAKDNPAGEVPVVIVISGGLATPVDSTATTEP